jgi:hypothetical protein
VPCAPVGIKFWQVPLREVEILDSRGRRGFVCLGLYLRSARG